MPLARTAQQQALIAPEVTRGAYFFLELKARKHGPLRVALGGRETCGERYEVERIDYPFATLEFVAEGAVSTVAAVLPGSPAAAAGLKPGDRLVDAAISGGGAQAVGTKAEAMKVLGKAAPGDSYDLTVKRGSQSLKIKVTAGKGGV